MSKSFLRLSGVSVNCYDLEFNSWSLLINELLCYDLDASVIVYNGLGLLEAVKLYLQGIVEVMRHGVVIDSHMILKVSFDVEIAIGSALHVELILVVFQSLGLGERPMA